MKQGSETGNSMSICHLYQGGRERQVDEVGEQEGIAVGTRMFE